MGRVKGKYLEDLDSGYTSGHGLNVCEQHFNDKDIVDFIKDNGSSDLVCSFCGNDNVEDQFKIYKIICWDDLMERISTSIKYFYDDPANGLSYESAEGGYFGKTYDTVELLEDIIGLDADYEIVQEIANSITQDCWTEGEFYGETYLEYLNHTWETFSNLVKYKVRFFFKEVEIKSNFNDFSHKPFDILNDIGKFILKFNLVFTIHDPSIIQNKDLSIYRARQHCENEVVLNCKGIGSPPQEFAAANRFSSEGISIFYGASDEGIAIKEILNPKMAQEIVSVGEFYTAKRINLIDLRDVPQIGLFNVENIELIEPSRFLRSFVNDISKRLDKHSNERIEYIPSQVVMEYFRYVLASSLNVTVHGIIYRSSHDDSKDCYAIFADSSLCSDMGDENENTLLIYKKNSIQKIRVIDILNSIN